MDAATALARGREFCAGQAWVDAYDSLAAADRTKPLAAGDLELLATSAYMTGREDEYFGLLERTYHAHLDADRGLAALRAAFWIGINLARRGELGRAGGWLARAQRLLDRESRDCVERGYLLLPVVFEYETSGDWTAAAETAGAAAAIGERFGDADLFALAAHEQGHILIRTRRLKEGLRLLDEAMVAVTAEELSPIVSGIVYCGAILACRDAFELRRAQEWTAALSRWCERQPGLVAFTGRCLVHRAEIMQLHGAWPEALEEARRARVRCVDGQNPGAAGEAHYREGEIHRLFGDLDAAERAYRAASRKGREPQPGLALVRLAQGNTTAATAAIRRVTAEAGTASTRAHLLPAFVEIMLAVGALDEARAGCEELRTFADAHEHNALGAMAAQARGAVELAEGDAQAALASLRRAGQVWRELEAAYEAARVHELVGRACRALDDEDGAALAFDAARDAFTTLGATRDVARVDALRSLPGARDEHALSARELQVLRLVAAGASNKAIAAELVLSVRTVDRHVSNILAKLGVASRTAATAYAHEHRLVP